MSQALPEMTTPAEPERGDDTEDDLNVADDRKGPTDEPVRCDEVFPHGRLLIDVHLEEDTDAELRKEVESEKGSHGHMDARVVGSPAMMVTEDVADDGKRRCSDLYGDVPA